MTRIGFAYNQKPDEDAPPPAEGEGSRPDEEPPSRRRDVASRTPEPPAATVTAGSAIDDEYAEWDSAETVNAVERALAALGTVVRLEATESFPDRLRAARPDIVFNMAEGRRGVNRESHVPAICEFFGVPYSGSDPLTLSLCLDKARAKEVLAYHGVPTAAFRVVRSPGDLESLLDGIRGARCRESGIGRSDAPTPGTRRPTPGLPLPLFLKPVHEGSSKGITERNLCRTIEEVATIAHFLLTTYRQPVLVEEYLPGTEFTCAVLGNGDGARVLPIVAMNFGALPAGAAPVYGYEAKWLWDRPERPLDIFECPARVSPALARAVERVALDAYRVLGCRDWSRIDVRLDAAGEPAVMEVNPLPGILPDPADNSCFPKAARAAGIGYDELIQRCLTLAAERQGVVLRAPAHAPRERVA